MEPPKPPETMGINILYLNKSQDTWDDTEMPSSPPLNPSQPGTNKKPLSPKPSIQSKRQKMNHASQVFDQLSSDPIAGLSPPESSKYANQNNLKEIPGKDKRIQYDGTAKTPNPLPQSSKSCPTVTATSTNLDLSEQAILQARDLIVKAYSLTQDRAKQTRYLDLLEIFREYTERGMLSKASNIIASQVANLETATRQIETKAKDLSRIAKPAIPSLQPQKPLTQTPKPSMAQVANQGQSTTSAPQEWTVVGKKQNGPSDRNLHPAQGKAKAARRVIFIQKADTNLDISPLKDRNLLNNAFAAKGIKGPVVNLVSKTSSGNIAITTTEEYTADFFLEKKEIWEKIIPHEAVQKDQPWYKVVAHGIPLADFNHESGMEMIKSEVMIFNKGLKPIGLPHWISSEENRNKNRAGSVAIAFATEEEANRAIRNRLYIAGISTRVTKYFTVAPTTQCLKCQAFGHLDNYCRREAKCGLCGEKHSTQQHYCSACKTKGKECKHLAPKCANCSEQHKSSSRTCQLYLSIKNRNEDPEL